MQSIWIILAVILYVQQSTTAAVVPREGQHRVTACSSNDTITEELRQARIEAIRQEILLRLNLDAPPTAPIEDVEADLPIYLAAVQTANQRSTHEECDLSGRGTTFFAKQRRLYFPSFFTADTPSVEAFEWGDLLKREKRDTKDTEPKNPEDKSTPDPMEPISLPTVATKYPTINGRSLDEYVSPLVYRLVFSDMEAVANSLIFSADLNLYKRKKTYDSPEIKQDSNPLQTVEVYQVMQMTGENGEVMRYSSLVGTKLVRTESDGYEQFNLTDLVKEWMPDTVPEDVLQPDLELELVIRTPESIETEALFLPSIEFDVPGVTLKGENKAQLVLSILNENEQHRSNTDILHSRRKRNSVNGVSKGYCFANPDQANCCVRELEINFHRDLDYTWILAPESYPSNYCDGLCPIYWPSETDSTSLLMELRNTNPTAAPQPCCVAKYAKPLTLLAVINGRIVLNELPDMRVESCICR